MQELKFGLIGKTLKHSYSKIIHQKFGGYSYELYELAPEGLKQFVEKKELNGYNVTIPYKKDIIPYLDFVDKPALDIGAVNTVVCKNDKLYGYNTDYLGMIYMLNRARIDVCDKVVMILGLGGTSLTARAVVNSLGAKEVLVVSRSGEINYQNCYERKNVQIIINTTPVGMFPHVDECAIDLSAFSALEGVVDVIYNPLQTKLIASAKKLNVKTTNGLPMLVAQAKYAMEYFLGKKFNDDIIEKVLIELKNQMQNIVLIGMPSSGKSSIGKRVSELLNREFIDVDKEIERVEKRTIPEIFAKDGEQYFRRVEKELVKEYCAKYGQVISTGGGVVKDRENLFWLRLNGKIFLIMRSLDKLCCEGRPLSTDRSAIERLYNERKDLYLEFADYIMQNDSELENAVKGVIKKYENSCD